MSWLKKEAKRVKEDIAGIAIRIKKTLGERCTFIDTHSVVDVTEKYPCLQDLTQVFNLYFLYHTSLVRCLLHNFYDKFMNKPSDVINFHCAFSLAKPIIY